MPNNKHTDVVIIGGGVAGLSTAYQLAKRNLSVTLIERQQLGAGSTGQAAGLLGQVRSTTEATRMLVDGLDVVRELEAETGQQIFCQTGSVRLATTPEREQVTKGHVALGALNNLHVELLDRAQLSTLLPYMSVHDVLIGSYTPSDGHLMPHELATSYATMARHYGATIIQGTPVTRIVTNGGRATGVETPEGVISADKVFNATGPWSYLLASDVGQTFQTAAIEHVYLTSHRSEQMPVDPMSPAVRDYDGRIYSRPEVGGLIVGIYEADPVVRDMAKLSDDFEMSQMRPQRDSLAVAYLLDSAFRRFPALQKTQFVVTQGIMTFTPNGRAMCGELPGVEGLFHAAGFCGHGIVQSPSIGVIMANLLTEQAPGYDMDQLWADRYAEQPGFANRTEIENHCRNAYSAHYGGLKPLPSA